MMMPLKRSTISLFRSLIIGSWLACVPVIMKAREMLLTKREVYTRR